jgi:hypothetical protein
MGNRPTTQQEYTPRPAASQAMGARARRMVLAGALLLPVPVFAQDAAPPASDPGFRPGFLEALGRWIGNSGAILDDQLKGTQDALDQVGTQATDAAKGAADAAKGAADATGAMLGLPGTRVVYGNERCAVASNDAPDCAAAAQALCKKNGLGNGSGLEVKSTRKCPAWVWLSGRAPAAGVCANETFVVRAMCQ